MMQDVSCEPLMLCPSENPQASLDIFSQPHHHPPPWSCIHRKAINKNKPSLSSGSFCSTTDRTDSTDLFVEERDQKVCCFPWAYALAARR